MILPPGHPALGALKCTHPTHIRNDGSYGVKMCCTICVICGQEAGANILHQGPVYYHQRCIPCPSDNYPKCLRYPTCSKDSDGNVICRIDCKDRCPKCKYCFIQGSQIITLDRTKYHLKCVPEIYCHGCPNIHSGDNLITDGEIVRHPECVIETCCFCKEPAYFVDLDKSYVFEMSKYKKRAHMRCVLLQKCSKCGVHDDNMTFDGEKFIHHLCNPKSCFVCSKTIGGQDAWEVGNDRACHVTCFSKLVCTVCNNKMSLDDFVETETPGKFRHRECIGILCSECFEPIKRSKFRKVRDKIYHLEHGPFCVYCRERREDESLLERNYQHYDVYSHSDCLSEICLFCKKHLGNPQKCVDVCLGVGNLMIHKSCDKKCNNCNLTRLPSYSIGFTEPTHILNRPYLRSDIKTAYASLLNAIKFGSVESAKKVPKDVLLMILDQIILATPFASASTPFVLDGKVNLAETCSHTRCTATMCKTCGKNRMAWDKNDITRCQEKRCMLVVKTLRRIKKEIFGSNPSRSWPGESTTGISEIEREFLEVGWTLSVYKLNLYSAMMGSLGNLMKRPIW